MFIGRKRELSELEGMYQRRGFHLFILYGRRRVGKTTFLKEFCGEKSAIFYSAEQTNDKLNLEKFSALIYAHYGEQNAGEFPSWQQAISYVAERQRQERLLLIFDEFPYLANANHGLMSVLQHLIDHYLQESNIFMILCGSYMGFMEKDVLGAQSPLFGRRTGQLRMGPFDYREAADFLQTYSEEERVLLYSVLGGTAMYLNQVDQTMSAEDNIQRLFLNKMGYLYEEPLFLLRQEVQEPRIYAGIMEAIAGGATRANEIAAKTGEESAKCLKYMATLRELGLIYKEAPLGEEETSRKTQYGISDPMFRFWYRYVATNRTLLEMDAGSVVWNKRIQPDLSHYMGKAFEKIGVEYLLRKNTDGQLPFLFTQIGRWWGNNRQERKEEEIDIVAKDGGNYLFCECKWRNERTGIETLENLKRRAKIFHESAEHSHYMLFSKSGFTEELEKKQKSGEVMLIGLAELFQ